MKNSSKYSVIYLLLLFWIISTQVSFTQETYDNSSLAIKLMPFSILDKTPRYRLGLEYISNHQLGYSLDFGYGNSPLNGWRARNEWGDDFSVYEIRPELKYLIKNKKKYNLYLALELFYIDLTVGSEFSSYSPEDSFDRISYESATLNRTKFGFHLKGGANIITHYRFNIDLYYGLGFARRIVDYTDVVNPIPDPSDRFNEWIIPESKYYEGKDSLFHFAMGIKFGYVLWWSKTHSSRTPATEGEAE